MIEELHIRGLGVIEDVTLELGEGLTVVTGETGVGKTLLVTALQLLRGARADASLVRAGEPFASAEAVLFPPPPETAPWLASDEDALIVSRELPAEGRSRARVGGRLAPVSTLAEVLGGHVEVHAQHEHVRLARPDVQRRLLDRFAGDTHGEVVLAYRDAHARWQTLQRRRADTDADARERARELDRLRAELEEIEEAAPDVAADAEIDHELEVLAHADEIRREAGRAAVSLGSEAAGEPLGVAVDALRALPVEDPELDALRARLDAVVAEVADLSAELRSMAERVEADPDRFDLLQERKRTLSRLTRKYGVDLPAVLAWARAARERVAELESDEIDAQDLDQRLAEADAAVARHAEELRSGRRGAAANLSGEVDRHLADLGMPHARFSVSVEPIPEGKLLPDGGDEVTFLLAANPGEPARPIATAASGGERSRLALAVEVVLADLDDAAVLVFDEVDAGIGGATAMAVGEKLARLAHPDGGGAGRQVLCVTHLAQLAAFADVHHVVEKTLRGERTVTTARRVAEGDREAELSRMLGGDATATAGLEHARELLANAARRRTPSTALAG